MSSGRSLHTKRNNELKSTFLASKLSIVRRRLRVNLQRRMSTFLRQLFVPGGFKVRIYFRILTSTKCHTLQQIRAPTPSTIGSKSQHQLSCPSTKSQSNSSWSLPDLIFLHHFRLQYLHDPTNTLSLI